jgi:hypothetical protein
MFGFNFKPPTDPHAKKIDFFSEEVKEKKKIQKKEKKEIIKEEVIKPMTPVKEEVKEKKKRPEKGSPEAMEWSKKMIEARKLAQEKKKLLKEQASEVKQEDVKI